MRFRSVVLPEPKKPVNTVTGIRFASLTTNASRAEDLRGEIAVRERRLQEGFVPHPQRSKPVATHQSPAAMFADLAVRPVSGLTSAFEECWRIAFPRLMTQWLSVRRYSFTVAGAAPGLVLVKRLKHAPASRFTCRHSRSLPKIRT